MSPAASLLDPTLLAGIEGLTLRAHGATTGGRPGLHRSARLGASSEFKQHKLYVAGDEPRRLDWHAFAKTDRPMLKQFEDENSLSLLMAIDASASMAYSRPPHPAKMDVAKKVTAALAFLALRGGDAAGLALIDAPQPKMLAPRCERGQLAEVMRQLAALTPRGSTNVCRALRHLAQGHSRPQNIFVLSDLFEPDPGLLSALRSLRARHKNVYVLHVLDPSELSFPFVGPTTFASPEDDRQLHIVPESIASHYRAAMATFMAQMRQNLLLAGIGYMHIDTAEAAHTMVQNIVAALR